MTEKMDPATDLAWWYLFVAGCAAQHEVDKTLHTVNWDSNVLVPE